MINRDHDQIITAQVSGGRNWRQFWISTTPGAYMYCTIPYSVPYSTHLARGNTSACDNSGLFVQCWL